MRIELHPEADAEFAAQIDYYEDQQPILSCPSSLSWFFICRARLPKPALARRCEPLVCADIRGFEAAKTAVARLFEAGLDATLALARLTRTPLARNVFV